MANANNDLNGILRRVTNLDGHRFELRFDDQFGYHITSGLHLWATKLKALALGTAMIEALSLATDAEAGKVITNIRKEWKRQEFWQFAVPAQKEWSLIKSALNRVEGLRPVVHGRKGVTEWVPQRPESDRLYRSITTTAGATVFLRIR